MLAGQLPIDIWIGRVGTKVNSSEIPARRSYLPFPVLRRAQFTGLFSRIRAAKIYSPTPLLDAPGIFLSRFPIYRRPLVPAEWEINGIKTTTPPHSHPPLWDSFKTPHLEVAHPTFRSVSDGDGPPPFQLPNPLFLGLESHLFHYGT